MPTEQDLSALAREIKTARDQATTVAPFSSRIDGFSLDVAYAIDAEVHALRLAEGARPLGRKIGFSNPRMWPKLGLSAPAWARLYEGTVVQLDADQGTLSLAGLLAPRIEPEIVVHFKSAPDLDGGIDGVLDAMDWLATGFEIVQSNYHGAAVPADAVANSVYHGRLVIGPRVAVADMPPRLADQLERFALTLSRDGQEIEKGEGRNVLGSPLRSVLALGDVLSRQPYGPIQAGEIITTGTVTTAHPIAPGQTWSLAVEGIALPGLTLAFTD
ncbi:MAG: 2-keto-4-pentenoate hydratase [Paracidovorax wautersii]|uniref:2-keto-4-pentenoate hydratase n=1 Tax=Paracidovorax wautersii TaxID=1177982 RepID=A0A7V8JNR6_9BURK|nr:MAG: 2-keto-4-pentenoate hydratase [Paracidovorax wautersii]